MQVTNPHDKHGWDKAIMRMNTHVNKELLGNAGPCSILKQGSFTPDQLHVLKSFINSFREETCEDEDVLR